MTKSGKTQQYSDRLSQRLSDGLRYPAQQATVPSFAGIAARAAKELPPEPYEVFFEESPQSRRHGAVRRRILASAAAIVLLLTGGTAVAGLWQSAGSKQEAFATEQSFGTVRQDEALQESDSYWEEDYSNHSVSLDALSQDSDKNTPETSETLSGCEDAILGGSVKVMVFPEHLTRA